MAGQTMTGSVAELREERARQVRFFAGLIAKGNAYERRSNLGTQCGTISEVFHEGGKIVLKNQQGEKLCDIRFGEKVVLEGADLIITIAPGETLHISPRIGFPVFG